MGWPKPWAIAMSRRLCGVLLNLSARPALKPSPPPMSTHGMSSCVWLLPLPSSFVQTMVVWSSMLPLPSGSGVSCRRFARKAICSANQVLILVSFSTEPLLRSGSCDSAWCPSSIPIHFMRAPPTEFVNWKVETRARSFWKALMRSSVCRRVICGMLSLSSGTPASGGCGTLRADCARLSCRPRSSSRKAVVCWSSSPRSPLSTAVATLARSSFSPSSTEPKFSPSFIEP